MNWNQDDNVNDNTSVQNFKIVTPLFPRPALNSGIQFLNEGMVEEGHDTDNMTGSPVTADCQEDLHYNRLGPLSGIPDEDSVDFEENRDDQIELDIEGGIVIDGNFREALTISFLLAEDVLPPARYQHNRPKHRMSLVDQLPELEHDYDDSDSENLKESNTSPPPSKILKSFTAKDRLAKHIVSNKNDHKKKKQKRRHSYSEISTAFDI